MWFRETFLRYQDSTQVLKLHCSGGLESILHPQEFTYLHQQSFYIFAQCRTGLLELCLLKRHSIVNYLVNIFVLSF